MWVCGCFRVGWALLPVVKKFFFQCTASLVHVVFFSANLESTLLAYCFEMSGSMANVLCAYANQLMTLCRWLFFLTSCISQPRWLWVLISIRCRACQLIEGQRSDSFLKVLMFFSCNPSSRWEKGLKGSPKKENKWERIISGVEHLPFRSFVLIFYFFNVILFREEAMVVPLLARCLQRDFSYRIPIGMQ